LGSVVENPDDVLDCLQSSWDQYTLSADSKEEMVIITSADMASAFEKLAEWKPSVVALPGFIL